MLRGVPTYVGEGAPLIGSKRVTDIREPRPRRTLILAPRGRDARGREGHICATPSLHAEICLDLDELVQELAPRRRRRDRHRGSDSRAPTLRLLVDWVAAQPPWSDFPVHPA